MFRCSNIFASSKSITMKTIITLTILFVATALFSQNTISGKVVDEQGKPVSGANIYIDGTYDGASSSETGDFTFETNTTGNQILVVSFLAFETSKTNINVANFENKRIKLKDNINALDAVVITAGTFEAGGKAKVSVLKPLDIVTTAGSAGNIIAA